MKSPKNYPYLRQTFSKITQRKICFIHIPKCGGTSIHHAIRNSFGLVEVIRDRNLVNLDSVASLKASKAAGDQLTDFREKILLYHLSNDCNKYISGHFAYSHKAIQNFGKEWNFITILRHPVSRWFSHYFFNRVREHSQFKIDSDLESFIESERGIGLGTEYVRKLTGYLSAEEAASEKAVDQAIQNLKNFALVGALENLDRFVEDYQERFGAKLLIQQRNTNPLSKTRQDAQITEAIRQKVEAICQPDLRIYESVLKKNK